VTRIQTHIARKCTHMYTHAHARTHTHANVHTLTIYTHTHAPNKHVYTALSLRTAAFTRCIAARARGATHGPHLRIALALLMHDTRVRARDTRVCASTRFHALACLLLLLQRAPLRLKHARQMMAVLVCCLRFNFWILFERLKLQPPRRAPSRAV